MLVILTVCSGADMSTSDSAFTGEPGKGFRKGAWHVGLSAGGAIGQEILGGRTEHDFLFGNVHAGRIVTETLAEDSFLAGACELRGELFGGHQLDPNRYVVGITPALRYHFNTGKRLIPFVQGGAGFSATDIRGPDLSTTFEFNLMCGGGVCYFVSDRMSIELDYRLFHLSNAGLDSPNTGVNSHTFLAGISWWY